MFQFLSYSKFRKLIGDLTTLIRWSCFFLLYKIRVRAMAKRAEHGSGHPDFLAYTHFIAEHSSYANMPDAYLDTGEIQWETPSNRTSGKYKDSHQKRRQWWHRKALEIGIDPNQGGDWLGRTAKRIHPTKEKPCKVCGRLLDIRFVYPQKTFLDRIRKLPYIDDTFPLDGLEHVRDLVTRLVEQFGDPVFDDLPSLFKNSYVQIPVLEENLDAWLNWILKELVPAEPKAILGPGAMANPPDRFDGFHSYNRCCRAKSDKGRSKENLQSYTTDRRVFEYWVDGDWVAADRLMGQVRSNPALKAQPCRRGHAGPCDADHIGPISLGFAHRPIFQFLCSACNGAKNNRMFLSDVELLRQAETTGQVVCSWYSQDLWDLRKNDVYSEETAIRLSKLLRDNRHTVMYLLKNIADRGHYAFLSMFLGLSYADYNVSFENLRAENYLTGYDAVNRSPRVTRYAIEQKARRVRVAFSSLVDYAKKEGRNAFVVQTPAILEELSQTIEILDKVPGNIHQLNQELTAILIAEIPSEENLRLIVTSLPKVDSKPEAYKLARERLRRVISLVAQELSSMWNADRYVRAVADED